VDGVDTPYNLSLTKLGSKQQYVEVEVFIYYHGPVRKFKAVFLSTDTLLTSRSTLRILLKKKNNKPRKHIVITGKEKRFSFRAIFDNVEENVCFPYLFHSRVNMCVCARVFRSYVHAYMCGLVLCLRCIHPTGNTQLTLPLGQNVRRSPIKFVFFLNDTFFTTHFSLLFHLMFQLKGIQDTNLISNTVYISDLDYFDLIYRLLISSPIFFLNKWVLNN